MRRTFVISGLVSVAVATFSSAAGAPPAGPEAILAMFPPAPSDNLLHEMRPHIGKKVRGYTSPAPQDAHNIGAVFHALNDNDPVALKEAMAKIDMKGWKFGASDPSLAGVLWLVTPCGDKESINFFWRTGKMRVPGDPSTASNPVDPLIFEHPHEGQDNTAPAAAILMAKTRARVMYINAIHPHSGPDDGKRHEADGAHQKDTTFFRAQGILEGMYPDAFFVQVHGMVDYPHPKVIFVNGLGKTIDAKYKSGPRLLASALQTYFSVEELGKMNMSAHQAAPFNPDPGGMHMYSIEAGQLHIKPGSGDSGRFVHIELGSDYRTGKQASEKIERLAKAFNDAMVEWQKNKMYPAVLPGK